MHDGEAILDENFGMSGSNKVGGKISRVGGLAWVKA